MPDDLSLDSTLRGLVAGERVFGRYVLERVLGRGGMGIVWLARDEALEKNVALKFIVESLARDPEAVANLKRETRRCQDLHHPGIVGIYDLQQDTDRVAVSMEYVEGSTLSAAKGVQPDMCFAPAEILDWMEQLAAVLSYAHLEARIVHRDLKPANLMLATSGRIKVMDFGIAHQLSDSHSMRSAGQPTGYTATFASPQQIMGERAAASDDIYSFGATIYDLVTGKPPFYSGKIEMQALQLTAPGMAERRTEFGHPEVHIPTAWESIVAACLSKDAATRPASAKEVAQALRAGFEEKTAPAPDAELTQTYHAAGTVAAVPTTAKIENAAPLAPVQSLDAQAPSAQPPPAETPQADSPDEESPREEEGAVFWQLMQMLRTLALVLLVAAGSAWGLHIVRDPQMRAQFQRPDEKGSAAASEAAASAKTASPGGSAAPASPAPATPRGMFAAKKLQGANTLNARSFLPAATPRPAEIPPAATTPGKPFTNSLGLNFVPVGNVFFCTTPARRGDFARFAVESHFASEAWLHPGFKQDIDHPVVNVSWNDAVAFCDWLTKKEIAAQRIRPGQEYRLPGDLEWSRAVGLPAEPERSPFLRSGMIHDVYPWGTTWPPPAGSGNFMGEGYADNEAIAGYRDGYKFTSPVGAFKPNAAGLYDMAGNVQQWCRDSMRLGPRERVLRGSSYYEGTNKADHFSSHRDSAEPNERNSYTGFRIVFDPMGK